jgi:glucose/mannose-6-phosphate isomerase
MIDLNSTEEIKKLDPKNVLGSTELVLEQCSQIWEDSKTVSFPSEYSNVKNIVFSGMGGSGLGAQITFHLFKTKLTVPFYINNDYSLPEFANEDTLVILSSYSGSTEETLASANEAIKKGCKITGLTTGGKLKELFEKHNFPYVKIDPKNNPAGQPRLGTGYATFGLIAIFTKIGVVNLNEAEIIEYLNSAKEKKEISKSKAQDLANKLLNSVPVIFVSEHLVGNAHVIRNQFNETSKSFAAYSPIPELNHHLLEGLKNPENKNLHVLFICSDLYSEKTTKRIELTKDVVSKNGIPYSEYKAEGDTTLSQVLNTLSFGGYLTLYLGLLYGQDPSLIPWVDYFKEKLK